jgi:YqcI/YcgG family
MRPTMEADADQVPLVSDSLRRFFDRSPCPFARLAGVAECEPWPHASPTAERLDAWASFLAKSIRSTRCDLGVLAIHGADELRSVSAGAALVRSLLLGLRERDPSCERPLTADIDDPGWDFEFSGERFFVSLFAPFYPPGHSRWSGERDIAFLLLQPERGFRRFGISSQHPSRDLLSERVHQRFKRHGQDYDLELNTSKPKALRYVKPLAIGDPPVRWWEPA